MTPPEFTHLQVHSHFTLLGATAGVEALTARAVQDGLTRLALTDTNVLYGVVAFDRACRRAGIQPITGMTLTLEPPDGLEGMALGEVTLLATGRTGYTSLCRLSSALQQVPERSDLPVRGLPWAALRENHAGLICLAGGRRSWVERALQSGNRAAAGRAVAALAGIFGEQAFLALDLQRPADAALAAAVVDLGQRFGLGVAAVQPIYCLEPGERARLRLLAAIARNTRLEALPPDALPDGGDAAVALHWVAPEALAARYAAFPSALATTAAIAQACAPALPDGRPVWPVLPLAGAATPDEALAAQAQTGLARRYPHADAAQTAQLESRLASELAAIARHGVAPLFLLVADVVNFARSHDIPASTRGSVANALVAYCLGITTVDPIEHNLLFERFLNPARASLPDIDMDFCSIRRDEVLDYVRRTFGADRVALVATVSTFRLRSAVRETAKAYGLDEEATGRLVHLLPESWHPDPRRRAVQSLEAALARVTDERLQPVVRAAFSILELPDHLSVHPGGVVVTPGPLTDVVPVQWSPKGFLITQYAHEDVEAIGLPKIDLLGIRALTVLADAAALVRAHYAPGLRLDELDLHDPVTGDLLARGETIGVFQCESAGAQRTLRQLRARSVRDLAVANAFFKPGPATGGMAQHFIRRYRGEETVTYLHPALIPILGSTMGVLIFQEQILRVAREIAGLSWEEADHLRRGMSKFQPEEMTAMRERFIAGCQRPDGPGLTPAQARTLWEQVEPFAGYGFNQGHATAYADVSYRSAYLKAHWPAAFLAARLANWGGYHYASTYIAEARRLGFVVHPPHINVSGSEFTLAVGWGGAPAALYMGLGQVRDLRQSAIQALIAGRADGHYRSLGDLLARVALQPKEVMHLVQCGALDGLGVSRAALLAEAEAVARVGAAQMAFGFMAMAVAPESAAERMAWEFHILGQPVSVHPLAVAGGSPVGCVPVVAVARQPGRSICIAGARLPGGTGGKGFFLADETSFCTVVLPAGRAAPPAWQAVSVQGRWLQDEWGVGWLQAERVEHLT